jgi:lipoate-protein ligase A
MRSGNVSERQQSYVRGQGMGEFSVPCVQPRPTTNRMYWRLLLSPPLDGPNNMALDQALMERARHTGESVLRVYSWATPVLSLGRNQTARNVYDSAQLAALGIGVVRRPTGGRALLHDHEITYSVTAPVTAEHSLNAAYGQINALLQHTFGTLGVRTSLAAPRSRSSAPTALPCFAEPSTGEIVANGRKLVGSAQWRDDGALLQHGSILVDDDQRIIPSLMRAPTAIPPAPATLRELLGHAPTLPEFAEAIFDATRSCFDPDATILTTAETDALDVDRLVGRFLDDAWTWRR